MLSRVSENLVRRSYDATQRRARAVEERSATRRKVVAAAADLFVERGYVGTTVAAIAERAGVALQSVYTAGGSKGELLEAVHDQAVVGDDAPIPLLARRTVAKIAQEPDPRRQVELFAVLIVETLERAGAVLAVYRDAAATDDEVASRWKAVQLRRLDTFRGIVDTIGADALALTAADAADAAWTIGSIDVFLLLRRTRGWSAAKYRSWLTASLARQLLP
jgi:AcrR family transcriptional regulator